MTHKFDIKNKQKLDNPTRRTLLPPKETLQKLSLRPGDSMADIGCGIGYFTWPAAEIVGHSGKVYALDIREEMLRDVEEGAAKNALKNIAVIKTEEYNLVIEDEAVNYCLISHVLHEITDLPRFVVEVKRILSPGGKIAVIEWEKIEGDFGPPIGHRLDKQELADLLSKEGFVMEAPISLGKDFYALLGQKGDKHEK